ncbi:MAG: hypothetical protein IKA22_03055 [Lentisphaeria bacterium]|nr:hypothetical protein [Lentisphaeria bacterium]
MTAYKDFCYCSNGQCSLAKQCKRYVDNHVFSPGDAIWLSCNKGGKECTMFVKMDYPPDNNVGSIKTDL